MLASKTARKGFPSDVQLIREIFQDKAEKVQQHPEQLLKIIELTWSRIRAHAGTRAIHEAAPPPVSQLAVERGAEPWLDTTEAPGRPPPPPDSRLARGISAWDVDRLGALPPHSVVVFERAQGRVRHAGTKASPEGVPSDDLLRALVHAEGVPTAVASAGDHYWLPALGRWASPTELMRLFGVPEGCELWDSVATESALSARRLVECFGNAVHTESAARAVRRAAELTDFGPPPLVYASACSGIDLIAQGVQEVFGSGFSHAFASERDRKVADLCARAWAHRGLSRDRVFEDACSEAACELAPGPRPDIWSVTPPCVAYSRRNMRKSEEEARNEMRSFDRMLDYARFHAPRAIIVENVDEPFASSCIDSALAALTGYEGESFVTEARDSGQMARRRRFWVFVCSAFSSDRPCVGTLWPVVKRA